MLLAHFRATRPRFEIAQDQSLTWLAKAHAEAEATLKGFDDHARLRFEVKIAQLLRRCAPGPDRIQQRGHSIADVDSTNWYEHALYDLRRHPHGRGTFARSQVFAEVVDEYFASEYAGERDLPDDIVHVTCTGYVSPSAPQKLVADRGWLTRITHAYHMGCYAAVPALRIAGGFIASRARRVDLVHTELCSLHLDPTQHALEQLVVQSLFGDGLIRYSLLADTDAPALRVLTVHERVLPDSAQAMSWVVADAGMHMTLSRDVPERIGAAVRGFVVELFRRAGRDLGELAGATCAIHPGGPKIIDQIASVLELRDAQVLASRGVLLDHGNMSSATLPHIWQRILDDPAIPSGTLIPSLAFGPGLTMCGALLEKR